MLTALLCAMSALPANAQNQTVGLVVHDTASFEGYTLFAPMLGTTAYLIDHYGRLVNTWEAEFRPGASVYLLENGHLLWSVRLETSDIGGSHVIEFDWDGNVVWEWRDVDPSYFQHHDIQPMPNGNVLILARDFSTAAEAFSAGRDTALLFDDTLWSEMVIEVEPSADSGGTIVWEWYLWDHLVQDFDPTKDNYGVVAEHRELMDINYADGFTDWVHANSVAYSAELDQIIISCRTIDEFWVIDHSTTTAEAASHSGGNSGQGGDFLYRWGNPQVYGAGDASDRTLDKQHDAQWIAPGLPGAGHILVFNNGSERGYSSIDQINTPVRPNGTYPPLDSGQAHGPERAFWTYVDTPPDSFFAYFISGTQRLPNGNTLICAGPSGEFREATPDGEIVWRYINPINGDGPVEQGESPLGNRVFRCYRYGPDYPALEGKDLTPTSALERNPVTISGADHSPEMPSPIDSSFAVTALIDAPAGVLTVHVYVDTGSGYYPITMYDDGSHEDGEGGDGIYGASITPPTASQTISYYIEVEDNALATVVDPANPPETVYYVKMGYLCGNIDGLTSAAGPSDVADLAYLIDYMYQGGPEPPDIDAANVDGEYDSGEPISISDLVYLIDYLFRGGPEPACE